MITIRIVASGRPIERGVSERLHRLVDDQFPALSIAFDDQCFDSFHHFAGSDKIRAESLKRALYDPKIDVVWLARGGYGTCRLLDSIDLDLVQSRVVAGYSDGNFLLAALKSSTYSGKLVHCPMPIDIARENGEQILRSTLNFLASVADGHCSQATIPCLADKPFSISAPAYACNLSVLDRILSTPFLPDLSGHILIIEDVSEHLYAIDRMLFQLFHSNLAQRLTAVALGQFSAVPENDVPFGETVQQMALRWSNGRLPILWNLPIGHVSDNVPILQSGVVTLVAKPAS